MTSEAKLRRVKDQVAQLALRQEQQGDGLRYRGVPFDEFNESEIRVIAHWLAGQVMNFQGQPSPAERVRQFVKKVHDGQA